MLKPAALLLALSMLGLGSTVAAQGPDGKPLVAAPAAAKAADDLTPEPDNPTKRKAWKRQWFGEWSPEYRKFMNQAAARERRAWKDKLPAPGAYYQPPVEALAPNPVGEWTNIGPTRSDYIRNGTTLNEIDSGRPRDIIVHPTDDQTIYMAVSSAGVWKTTDGGATWTPKTETLGTLSVGALAMDPANANVLYLGLGDPFDGTGIGLVKTTDGGDTWSAPVYLGSSTSVRSLQVSRNDSDIVLAATDIGLFRSTDAGATWTASTLTPALTGQTVSMGWEVDWAGGTVFVATVEARDANYGTSATAGSQAGQVWRSTDDGASWTRVLNHTGSSRLSLAVSPSNPNVMYAMGAIPTSGLDGAAADLSDLFKSFDNGATWTAFGITTTTAVSNTGPTDTAANGAYNRVKYILGGQGFYNHQIIVHPTNPYVFFYGGQLRIDRATSANSGSSYTYRAMSDWLAQFSRPYVHADMHSAAFDSTGALYAGGDGGIFKSSNILTAADGAHTFSSALNEGLITHMFYSVGSSPANPSAVIGGLQDNGTRVRKGSTSTFDQPVGGDGFGAHIHQLDADLMLGSLYNTRIQKSTDGGSTFSQACSGITECNTSNAPFHTRIVAYAGDATGNTVYTHVNTKIYRSTNYAGSWTALAGTVANIRNFGVNQANSNYIGIAATAGRVFLSNNGGATFTQAAALPNNGSFMSSVAFDPVDLDVVYATSVAPSATATHAWRSDDFGASWTAIDGNGLPAGVPINAITLDPSESTVLYAATHLGVYQSADSGATWVRFGSGMPLVQVSELYVSPDGTLVRAGTYGRGIWDYTAAPAEQTATSLAVSPASGTAGTSATLTATLTALGNPVSGKSVSFTVDGNAAGSTTTNASGVATLTYSLVGVGAGSYPVAASFAGDLVYIASNDSDTLTVTATPASACFTDTTQAHFETGTTRTSVDTATTPDSVLLARGADVVDQEVNDNGYGSGYGFNSTSFLGQTFTAATSGRVKKIDLTIFCASCSGADPNIVVELRTTTSLNPDMSVGALLATATIPGTSSGSSTTLTATFATPPSVTAGTMYGVVVKLASNRTAGTQAWLATDGDAYAGGRRKSCTTASCANVTGQNANSDLVLKEYLEGSYASSGTLVSAVKDPAPAAVGSLTWTTLSWTGSTPTNTTLRFQVAASNNVAGPFTFVGPDGLATSYFTSSGASLAQFNGLRYLKYKAYLDTTNAASTPTLADVTACYEAAASEPSDVSISPTSYTFPDRTVGQVSPSGKGVTFTNSETVLGVNISAIGVTGDYYIESNNCPSTLGPSSSCLVVVKFAPTAIGIRNGVLTIASDATNSPHETSFSGRGIVSIATSVSSVTFPERPVGVTSAPKSFVLSNTNTVVAASVDSIAASGDFAQTNDCPASLAPSGTCTITVTFTATTAGTRTGAVTITSNAHNSPRVVALTGTGSAELLVSPSSLAFPERPVGVTTAAKGVTLTNPNATASVSINNVATSGDFSQTNDCPASLAAGAFCTVSVQFTPTAAGVRTGTLTVLSTAATSPHNVALSGSGTADTTAAVSPSSLTFPERPVGVTSAVKTVSFSNTGSVPVSVTSIAASGDFAQTNDCPATLAVGTSCTVSVQFTATAAGTRTGTLTIVSNATTSPHSVALSGSGTADTTAAVSPSSLTFPERPVGVTSAVKTVSFSNTGSVPVSVTSIAASGDFAQTNDCPATLAVGTSCTVSVQFTATVSGTRTGTLTIVSNATTSPHTVALSGSGSPKLASLSPSSIAFPNREAGTTGDLRVVKLTNTNTLATLNVATIGVTGDFSQTNDCPASLAPGAFCSISVQFAPTTTGSRTGTLTVTTDAGNSPHTTSLGGNGMLTMSTSVTALGFPSRNVGTTAGPKPVVVGNVSSTLPIQVSSIAVTGDFTQTNDCPATLAPGASCTVSVTFGPTAVGTRTGTLTVTSDATNSPRTVALSGSGL